MRRHHLLLILIVALILALALLKSRWRSAGPLITPAPTASAVSPTPEVDDPSDLEEEADEETAAPPAPLPPPRPPPPIPVQKIRPKDGHCLVTVLGMDGAPVKKAVVLVMKYKDSRTPHSIATMETDEEGTVEVDMKELDFFRFYAYKPGKGATFSAMSPMKKNSVRTVTLRFRDNRSMRFLCMETNGAPAENAEVTLVTELHLSSRTDEQGRKIPVMFAFPARKAVTDRFGRCEIDALFFLEPWAREGFVNYPGTRYMTKAIWQDLASPDKTLEGLPSEVVLHILSLVR